MRLQRVVLSAIIFLPLAARASNITYNLTETVNGENVTGTITTDGNIGTLYYGDVVGWNLTFTGAKNDVSQTGDGFQYGGAPTLSATPTELDFNFGAGGASILAFYGEAGDFVCFASGGGCAGNGIDIDGQFAPMSGVQPIATAQVAGGGVGGATPEPSSFALLGTGLLGAAGALRKRVA